MSTEEVKSLVEELRYGAEYGCDADLIERAADAIEELQAELNKKRTADCWGCKCGKIEPPQEDA